jgi:hypothetical protein
VGLRCHAGTYCNYSNALCWNLNFLPRFRTDRTYFLRSQGARTRSAMRPSFGRSPAWRVISKAAVCSHCAIPGEPLALSGRMQLMTTRDANQAHACVRNWPRPRGEIKFNGHRRYAEERY